MDYLTAVNEAIEESKMDLDLLTNANFNAPPRTSMYRKMKRWVAQAYDEVVQKRDEWQFKAERTVVTVRPRMRLGAMTGTVSASAVYYAEESGVGFLVTNVILNPNDPRADVIIEYEYLDDTDTRLRVGEYMGPAGDPTLGRIEGVEGYDFSEHVPSLDEVDISNVYIQEVFAADEYELESSPQQLVVVDHDTYAGYSMREWDSAGKPMYITYDPDGTVQLYPRPSRPFRLVLPYSRKTKRLNPNDPTDSLWPIPENLQMVVVWKAVMKYANYDQKSKLFLDAKKNYEFWERRLEHKHLPPVSMHRNVFWG